jgi:hypothetical protein
MNLQQAKALRQWIRDMNALGLRYGYEDMEYIERFEAGETPAQVMANNFGDQTPTC